LKIAGKEGVGVISVVIQFNKEGRGGGGYLCGYTVFNKEGKDLG
jgi:hypothetical protein